MIKILIIEKQTIVAEGLRVLLEEEPDFQIFLSSNKDIKIDDFKYLEIGVILVSLENMDESDFAYLDIFYKLNNDSTKSQFISPLKLIIYAEKVDNFILNKAWKLDCRGYLLKDSSIEELKLAIRSVNDGYKHIGNSVFTKIKQLSIDEKSPNEQSTYIIPEHNLINTQEYLTTDLITTDSNELDFETNKINDQEIVIPASKKKFDNKLTKTTKLKDNFLPSLFSSKLLLVGWGCLAGAIGVFLVKSRMAKSYSPIIKYGKVKGKIVTIDNIYAGKLKTLNYEVGDLVKAKEIVAEIESQSNKEKSKTIQEITNQIEKINNHIESQKQSQLVNQSNLNRDRKKLKELLAKNSDFNYNTISKQGKSTFDEQLNLQNVQKEVDEASTNYDKLQKLLEQKAVSLEEVERAKQNWKALQKKLTQLQNNSQSQNLADLLQQVEKRKAIDQNNLQYIQENIERWETQISDQDNTIKLLVQDLNDAKDRLKILYDSYQATQIINVKAPVRGAISQIKINNNEVIDENQTFIELVDCNNLWVEVIVNNSLLEKINMRQAVLLSLEAHQFSLPSKISSIYPMQNYHKKNSENSLDYVSGSKNISNQNTLDNQSLFKIKIDFPIPENHAQKIMFCGWQETATIIFNN